MDTEVIEKEEFLPLLQSLVPHSTRENILSWSFNNSDSDTSFAFYFYVVYALSAALEYEDQYSRNIIAL